MLRILCAFGFEIGFDLRRHFALRNESSRRGAMRRPVRGGSVGLVGELNGGKGANALIRVDFTSEWIVSEWPTIRSELAAIGNLETADGYVTLLLMHNRLICRGPT